MGKLFVKFEGNWADEMDIEGYTIMSEEEWEYKQLEGKNIQFPVELGIGTNEQMIYESLEDYLENFKVQKISDEEIKTLKKFFGECHVFGFVPLLEGNAPHSFYEEHGYCPD